MNNTWEKKYLKAIQGYLIHKQNMKMNFTKETIHCLSFNSLIVLLKQFTCLLHILTYLFYNHTYFLFISNNFLFYEIFTLKFIIIIITIETTKILKQKFHLKKRKEISHTDIRKT